MKSTKYTLRFRKFIFAALTFVLMSGCGVKAPPLAPDDPTPSRGRFHRLSPDGTPTPRATSTATPHS